MKAQVIKEAGLNEALYGMALSYHDRKIPVSDWWNDAQREKAFRRSKLLAHKDGGHNKFLESIVVWLDIEASRDVWSEFDTYRVGTTKQSESTMHTLSKRAPEECDFEDGTDIETIMQFQQSWLRHKSDVTRLKKNLPEGWLQRRVVCTNYKVLRNIIWQRESHRLEQWPAMCESILAQVEHPYYLAMPEEE